MFSSFFDAKNNRSLNLLYNYTGNRTYSNKQLQKNPAAQRQTSQMIKYFNLVAL